MTREQAIHDLEVLKEYFIEESSSFPVCLQYAIEVLKGSDPDDTH